MSKCLTYDFYDLEKSSLISHRMHTTEPYLCSLEFFKVYSFSGNRPLSRSGFIFHMDLPTNEGNYKILLLQLDSNMSKFG